MVRYSLEVDFSKFSDSLAWSLILILIDQKKNNNQDGFWMGEAIHGPWWLWYTMDRGMGIWEWFWNGSSWFWVFLGDLSMGLNGSEMILDYYFFKASDTYQ